MKFKETDAQFKAEEKLSAQEVEISETDKFIQSVIDKFESPWCQLVDILVEGELIRLLQKRGIEVYYTSTRVKGSKNACKFHFDIFAQNNDEIVVVEVKTTLKIKHVKQFLKELKGFKELLPEYEKTNVYGAIAFLNEADNAATFAEKQKLFVIRATGDSAAIVNEEGFEPRVF